MEERKRGSIETPLDSETVRTSISLVSDKYPPREEAALVVIYGEDLGRKYDLKHGQTIIGRAPDCEISLDEDSVSRKHAEIQGKNGVFVLADMQSTNGTLVNDEAVQRSPLRDGDYVKVGRTIFKFLAGGNLENAYHEEIYRLTTVDGLTGIFNRRYVEDQLERELYRALRYGHTLAFLLFDVDHFKRINDEHGHLAGDHVLRDLSRLVRTGVRRDDVFGRWGGEEFALITPESSSEKCAVFGEKLRAMVAGHKFVFDNKEIPMTVSVGLALLDENCQTREQLVRRADHHLYKAKFEGRNRVCGP